MRTGVKINGGLKTCFKNENAISPRHGYDSNPKVKADNNAFVKAMAKTIVKGGSYKIRRKGETIDMEVVYE